jgi:hypothetical protein
MTSRRGRPVVAEVARGPDGLTDVRVYGAHEHRLSAEDETEQGRWTGGRCAPALTREAQPIEARLERSAGFADRRVRSGCARPAR